MTRTLIVAVLFIGQVPTQHLFAQEFKSGFEKSEYRELLLISARTTTNEEHYKDSPVPNDFRLVYQSEVVGLDNLWGLWISDNDSMAVISIRGTTDKLES